MWTYKSLTATEKQFKGNPHMLARQGSGQVEKNNNKHFLKLGRRNMNNLWFNVSNLPFPMAYFYMLAPHLANPLNVNWSFHIFKYFTYFYVVLPVSLGWRSKAQLMRAVKHIYNFILEFVNSFPHLVKNVFKIKILIYGLDFNLCLWKITVLFLIVSLSFGLMRIY